MKRRSAGQAFLFSSLIVSIAGGLWVMTKAHFLLCLAVTVAIALLACVINDA